MSNTPRFTLDGGARLEARLEDICRDVLDRVRKIVPEQHLEGLLLGGGYGRGEGGVLRHGAEEEPYNDLEFYVFVHGALPRRFAPALTVAARELHQKASVEIEFKPISRTKLERSPPSMFYYDLVMGHRRLWGTDDLLAGCGHHREAEKIPVSEAARLLMNRCSGLLFALDRLTSPRFTGDDADFVARNHAKAQLAFGDVILTVWGQYHWSCLERHRRLKQLAEWHGNSIAEEALRHHARGVEFKLHPFRSTASRLELSSSHACLAAFARELWLWLETRRLGTAFYSASEYAAHPMPKLPLRPARNVALNLAVFGPPSLLKPKLFRDPRERLLESLPLLLWETGKVENPSSLRLVQERLMTRASDFHGLADAYARLWKQFN